MLRGALKEKNVDNGTLRQSMHGKKKGHARAETMGGGNSSSGDRERTMLQEARGAANGTKKKVGRSTKHNRNGVDPAGKFLKAQK